MTVFAVKTAKRGQKGQILTSKNAFLWGISGLKGHNECGWRGRAGGLKSGKEIWYETQARSICRFNYHFSHRDGPFLNRVLSYEKGIFRTNVYPEPLKANKQKRHPPSLSAYVKYIRKSHFTTLRTPNSELASRYSPKMGQKGHLCPLWKLLS